MFADNYPEPGKRPLSSTTPTIIEDADGSFHLAIGASGGSHIFGAVLQVILGLDEWGLDVSQAIEYGRVHDQLYPLTTTVDNRIPENIVEELRERHHNITRASVSNPYRSTNITASNFASSRPL